MKQLKLSTIANILISTTGIFCSIFSASVNAQVEQSTVVEFTPLIDFYPEQSAAGKFLSGDKLAGPGAVVVNPQDFPATVLTSSAIGGCTATFVGPETLLTAAHCVGNGARINAAGQLATCAHSPAYKPNSRYGRTADYALCKTDQPLRSQRFENIQTTNAGLFRNNFVLLTGYGCTQLGAPVDGALRAGWARIIAAPTIASNDIVTNWDYSETSPGVGATLCPGDSGGPSYLVNSGDSLTPRVIIGVNSRTATGCLRGRTPDGSCINNEGWVEGRSFISSLSTTEARAFLTDWTARNGTTICGFNLTGAMCL